MARKVQTVIEFVDDLDQTILDEAEVNTFNFSWLGKDYQIDLKPANATKFEKAIGPFIEAATEVRGGNRSGRKASGSTRAASGSGLSKEELANAREWLTANGHEVSGRGRIKAELLDIYNAAHSK